MAKNLFDIIASPSFFKPLANSSAKLNYELLRLLDQQMSETGQAISRQEALDLVSAYLANTSFDKSFNDETGEDEADSLSTNELAARKLRYFLDCGWLTQDIDRNFKSLYEMDSFAISLLKTMDEAIKGEERAVELTPYVHNIYTTLCISFDFSHSYDNAWTVFEAAKRLSSLLRGINNRVRRFLKKLLDSPDATPEEILGALLLDYQNSIVIKGFENLRRKDNPSAYRDPILSRLQELESVYMDQLVADYLSKQEKADTPENRLEAERFYKTCFDEVNRLFSTIDDTIASINKKNGQYVDTSRSRLEYILSEDRNLEGRISDLLRDIQSSGFDEETDFGLLNTGILSPESLRTSTRRRERIAVRLNEAKTTIDPEELRKSRERLSKLMEYSVPSIDAFAMHLLGDKPFVFAKDVSLVSKDEMLKLLLVEAYSTSALVHYRVELENESFSFQNSSMTNFKIERK